MMKFLCGVIFVLGFMIPSVRSQALMEPDPVCMAAMNKTVDCWTLGEQYRCDPLPMIPQSIGVLSQQPEIAANGGYLIESPRDGVYGVTDGTYWMMIFVGSTEPLERCPGNHKSNARSLRAHEEGDACEGCNQEGPYVVLVDFPPSINITGALDEILFTRHSMSPTDLPPIKMMYSHDHLDHIGGATVVHNHIVDVYGQECVDVIASQNAVDFMQERLDEGRWLVDKAPVATIGIEGDEKLEVGPDMTLELKVISAHTEGRDVVVFLPRKTDSVAVLMFVDIAYAGWAPFYDAAIAADLLGYQQSMDTFLAYDFVEGDYFCGGHLTKTGTLSDLILFKRMVDAAFMAAGIALGTADPTPLLLKYDLFSPTSPNFANSWLQNDLFIDLAARHCLTSLLPDFGCLLAGLDIMGYSMCHSIIIYYITET